MSVIRRVLGVAVCTLMTAPAFADFATDGFFTNWLSLGPLTHQETACSFPVPVLTLDYMTGEDNDTGDSIDEEIVIPLEFSEILIDFAEASSTEVQVVPNGQNPGAPDSAVWVRNESFTTTIDDNVFYGNDPNHHVSIHALYLTNTSDDPLFLMGGIGSDDALAVLMDNTYFGLIVECRAVGADGEVQNRFPFVLPPGEHRILVKLFDWEGGSAFRLRLEQLDGTPVLEGGDVEVSLEPSIEDVPPPPVATAVRSFPDEVFPATPFDVTLTVTDGPVTLYEQIPEEYSIEDAGGATQTGQMLVWDAADGVITYTLQLDDTATGVFFGAAEEPGGVWLGTQGPGNPSVLEEIEGWFTTDIADSGLPGAADIIEVEDEQWDMEITGSGHDIWDTADDFRYVWKVVPADKRVILQARLDTFPRVTNDWGKAGLMMRREATQGSPMVFAMIRPGPAGAHEGALQWRNDPDTAAAWGGTLVGSPLQHWVRAIYDNGVVSGYFAPDMGDVPGEGDWIPSNAPSNLLNLDGRDSFLVGLAVTSHDDAALAIAQFSSVTLTQLDPIEGELSDLTATFQGLAGDDVGLEWTNTTTDLDEIKVFRTYLGSTTTEEIATIASDATSYADTSVPAEAAVLTYTVSGVQQGIVVPGPSASVSRDSIVVFQDGASPTPDYDGCQDAHIIYHRTDTDEWNTGANEFIEEGDWGANFDKKEALVQFDISGFDGEVGEAKLWLYYSYNRNGSQPGQGGGTDHIGYAAPLLQEWNEGTGTGADGLSALDGEVTWQSPMRNQTSWELWDDIDEFDCPGVMDPFRSGGAYGPDDVDLDAAVPSGEGLDPAVDGYGSVAKWVEWDVTSIVRDWVANPNTNNGLKITQQTEYGPCEVYAAGGSYAFVSSNSPDATLRPALVISSGEAPGVRFRRGDPDNSGGGNITDAIAVLNHLFAGTPQPACWAAADANGDGSVNVADPVFHLNFLFGGGAPPVAPGPDDCGPESVPGTTLECGEYTTC